MVVRPWVVALAVLAFAPACLLFGPRRGGNVLLISVDGLRQDALATAIGAPRTPQIQRLAGSGVRFEQCYAHSAATLPAQAALLSSCGPAASRVRVDGQDVPADVELIQEVLRDEGWQTFGVIASTQVCPPSPGQGLDRGFHLVRTSNLAPADADEVAAQAIQMLARARTDAPWFAYVAFTDPTAPYDAHGTADRHAQLLFDGQALDAVGTSGAAEWRRTLKLTAGVHALEARGDEAFVIASLAARVDGETLPITYEAGVLGQPGRAFRATFTVDRGPAREVELTAFVHDAPEVLEARTRYRLEVEAVDRAIGELVMHLENSGQYDDTTIVVVAPHGESLGEHNWLGHDRHLYDEVLRVPLVIKPALGTDALGALSQHRLEPVRVVDVAPTLLQIAGAGRLRRGEGLSLLEDGDRTFLAEVHPPQSPSTLIAVRDDRYKLVYTASEDRFEMYDMRSDTLEMENVFTLQGHFRPRWQAQLRDLAERAPQIFDQRLAAATQRPAR